jgi:hypothetical protein
MRKLRDILQFEIPPAAILRFWLVALGFVSLGLISLMIYVLLLPPGSGQTPGDAIMSKGFSVAILSPFAGLSAVLLGVVTYLNRSQLSLVWLVLGYSPATILGSAIFAIFFVAILS